MFRNMEYVYSVYKERSFSKAAEKLHISQPSLSATIRKIEEQAGAPIFERKTRPVSLTPFGVAFIQGVEQVYAIEENLQNMVYELHTLQSGFVSIGGSNLSVPYVIPQKLAAFKLRYPNVQLRIVEDTTVQTKVMLDNGDLDLIITNRPLDPEEYERLLCYREQLVLAVPEDFPVNGRHQAQRLRPEELGPGIARVPPERCVSLTEFSDIPYVVLQEGNYLRLCTDVMFQECRLQPHVLLEVQKSAVAYNFAHFGLGATIISNMLVAHRPVGDGLVYYKIRSDHAARDAYLCYRRGRYVTTAMKKIIELLTEPGAAGPLPR